MCSESSEILPQVLVGPTDWKEHASGKSPDRFRASNLPSHFDGAGIYELGVTPPPTWLPPQRKSNPVFLKPQDMVVVYLGCTVNVLHHLQCYGQTGAHLKGARLVQPLQSGTIQHFNTSPLSNSISLPSRAGQRDCSLRGMKPRAEHI